MDQNEKSQTSKTKMKQSQTLKIKNAIESNYKYQSYKKWKIIQYSISNAPSSHIWTWTVDIKVNSTYITLDILTKDLVRMKTR